MSLLGSRATTSPMSGRGHSTKLPSTVKLQASLISTGSERLSSFIDRPGKATISSIDWSMRTGPLQLLGIPCPGMCYACSLSIIYHQYLVSCQHKQGVKFPDEKVRYEVATMRYVAANTTIPVPEIYHWGTAEENPGIRPRTLHNNGVR